MIVFFVFDFEALVPWVDVGAGVTTALAEVVGLGEACVTGLFTDFS